MVARDAMDMRLLSLVAEAGRIAVHELAATVGLDARDVAARLVALSGGGLPLLVGVECDQKALRNIIAGAGGPHPGAGGSQHPPSGQFPVRGPAPNGPPSGAHPVQPNSGAFRAQPPSGAFGVGPPPVRRQPPRAEPQSPPSGSVPVQAVRPQPAVHDPQPACGGADPISVWGPPQSASWARGDEPTQPATRSRNKRKPPAGKRGGPGDTLLGLGPRGEQAQLKLIEVLDPADELLRTSGHAVADGQRAVVVHVELTNGASTPFPQRADEHLELLSLDGDRVRGTPLALAGMPAHHSGVGPGETAAGHTVFLVPADAKLTTVRWSAGGQDDTPVSWRLSTTED